MNKFPLIPLLPLLGFLSLIWLGSGVQADTLEKDTQLMKAEEYNTQVVEYYKKGQYQEAFSISKIPRT